MIEKQELRVEPRVIEEIDHGIQAGEKKKKKIKVEERKKLGENGRVHQLDYLTIQSLKYLLQLCARCYVFIHSINEVPTVS